MPSYNSMEEVAEDRKAALKMSPYKAYGKAKKGGFEMQGMVSPIVKKCGSKRHGKK